MLQIVLGTIAAIYTSDLENEIKELKELNELKDKKIIRQAKIIKAFKENKK